MRLNMRVVKGVVRLPTKITHGHFLSDYGLKCAREGFLIRMNTLHNLRAIFLGRILYPELHYET